MWFHSSWPKILWSAESANAGAGASNAGVPHHPTVELESTHTVHFPYKGDAQQLAPIVLSFLFQGQQPL